MGTASFSSLQKTEKPLGIWLNLSLNPSIYGISLPLSASISNQGLGYSLPFNTLSFSPSYKWIKLYAGRSSMHFSDYGLSGHSFDGAGIELTPSFIPLKFSAMYGRLQKAQAVDTSSLPSDAHLLKFQRMAYAFKIGSDFKGQSISLSFFHAKDKHNSLDNPFLTYIHPKENWIISGETSLSLWESLRFNGQFSISKLLEYIPENAISSWHNALKVGISYLGISLAYERVSPTYESLGMYYISNDFEITIISQ